jgi:hypothetical protein
MLNRPRGQPKEQEIRKREKRRKTSLATSCWGLGDVADGIQHCSCCRKPAIVLDHLESFLSYPLLSKVKSEQLVYKKMVPRNVG